MSSEEATSTSTSTPTRAKPPTTRGAKSAALVHDLPPGEKPTSPAVPILIISVPLVALVVYAIVSG